jgi:hypothetical protein
VFLSKNSLDDEELELELVLELELELDELFDEEDFDSEDVFELSSTSIFFYSSWRFSTSSIVILPSLISKISFSTCFFSSLATSSFFSASNFSCLTTNSSS